MVLWMDVTDGHGTGIRSVHDDHDANASASMCASPAAARVARVAVARGALAARARRAAGPRNATRKPQRATAARSVWYLQSRRHRDRFVGNFETSVMIVLSAASMRIFFSWVTRGGRRWAAMERLT